jgi:hypothetical protein
MITMKEISFDKEDFKRQMGNRLLYLRNLHKMSLEEVSEKIGVSPPQEEQHKLQ